MAKLERVYNIPIRREWMKAPPYKRAKKAVTAVRQFLMHHMKSETVKLGLHLNEAIWERGIKKPPHHIKVTVLKDDEGVVRAELFGFAVKDPKKEEKKGRLESLKEKLTGTARKKAAPAPKAKPAETGKGKAKAAEAQPAAGTLEAVAESAAAETKAKAPAATATPAQSAMAPAPAATAGAKAAPKRIASEKAPTPTKASATQASKKDVKGDDGA